MQGGIEMAKMKDALDDVVEKGKGGERRRT